MMENIPVNAIDKMFEYNLWANTQLIGLCAQLSEEQLTVEVEGVFGRIHPTLVHIFRAEGGYLNRMTGKRPWVEDEVDWQNIPLSDLLEKAKLSGTELVKIASKIDPAKIHEVHWQDRQMRFFNWTVMLQALYHGIEHRTQTKILLTQLGVPHPELAAWDYTESL